MVLNVGLGGVGLVGLVDWLVGWSYLDNGSTAPYLPIDWLPHDSHFFHYDDRNLLPCSLWGIRVKVGR